MDLRCHPQVKNLYFVGSSVQLGTGVSLVILSSKLVTEQVIKCYTLGKWKVGNKNH